MFQVLDRIAIDNELATIKFIGQLPPEVWGNTVALGIEWDQPKRGKNNGDINGVQYFQVSSPMAGSFIKATNKKIKKARTFASALVASYATHHQFSHDIHFGSKVAEGYGFDKLNELQGDLTNLKSLSLQRHEIGGVCGSQDLQVLASLSKVDHLDLSYNLFNDIDHVWAIVELMPRLSTLVLNGNRFFNTTNAISHQVKLFPTITTLHLSSTRLSMPQVNQMLHQLPNLTRLYLAGNLYHDDDVRQLAVGASVTLVDLSFNELTTVPASIAVETLRLSDNKISTIPRVVSRTTTLDLRNNCIGEWAHVDAVAQHYICLRHLQIDGNPLFDCISLDEMTIGLIGRLPCSDKHDTTGINKLNGTFLTSQEIENAELYFISQARQGNPRYTTTAANWARLARRHRMDLSLPRDASRDPSRDTSRQTSIASKTIPLRLQLQPHAVSRVFLTHNSVLRLKGIVSKYLGISILHFDIYYDVNEFTPNTSIPLEQCLDDYTAVLANYAFVPNQSIYIRYKA